MSSSSTLWPIALFSPTIYLFLQSMNFISRGLRWWSCRTVGSSVESTPSNHRTALPSPVPLGWPWFEYGVVLVVLVSIWSSSNIFFFQIFICVIFFVVDPEFYFLFFRICFYVLRFHLRLRHIGELCISYIRMNIFSIVQWDDGFLAEALAAFFQQSTFSHFFFYDLTS